MSSDGTSYENIRETVAALTGSWSESKNGWSLGWEPRPFFDELSVVIRSPIGESRPIVTSVFEMPIKILELVTELRVAFEQWKIGHHYCFLLPSSLQAGASTWPVPTPSSDPIDAEKVPVLANVPPDPKTDVDNAEGGIVSADDIHF